MNDIKPIASAPSGSWLRLKPFVPPIAYMALIAWFSAQPGSGIDLSQVPLRDKGVHFVEFAVLAILFGRALWLAKPAHDRSQPRAIVRAALLAILLTAIWGYLDELHQAFVPGRTSDRWDLLADVLGAIAGTSIYFGVLFARRRSQHHI